MTFALLKERRFAGLFWTQFLGALNDNFFKNALVLLVLYRLATADGPMLVTAAAGIFILPFFLFSATAGELADRYERAWLTRQIKIAEIVIMAAGALALLSGSVPLLLAVLFLMGTQSTLFGPIKYGILPDLLERNELMLGNGLIEGGTFLAILIGTILGGVLVLQPGGTGIVSIGILVLAALGYMASRNIPAQRAADPSVRISWNIAAETWRLMSDLLADRRLKLAAIGVSWFWFIGAIFLAQVPTFTKSIIGADEQVVTLFLTLFSVGIGIGSMLAAKVTHDRVSTVPVPLAAIGMAVFTIDLYFAAEGVPAPTGLMSLATFVAQPFAWRLMLDLVAIALSGGLFVVPLFAAIQTWAHADHRARVIAAVNVVNAAFMVASALITLALQALGLDTAQIFLCAGIANIVAAAYVVRLLPDDLLRSVARTLFTLLYRLEVRGLTNLEKAGPRSVVVVNHLSFLDAPIMLSLLHDKPLFAIYSGMAKRWWVRPFLTLVEALPVDPGHPMAVKTLVGRVKEGKPLVIFPEGRITVTGALMKIYDGPAMIADKADATIVPVRIEGAEQTPFSRLTGLQVRRRWFPKIRVTFLEPQRLGIPSEVQGRARRVAAGDALYDLLCALAVRTSETERTLMAALVAAARRHAMGALAIEDMLDTSLSYRRLLAGAAVLARKLEGDELPGETVGVMLPNAAAAVVSFLALQTIGRVPAMINFTAGAANVLAGCRAAGVRRIVTSRGFVAQAHLEELAAALGKEVELVWLEDLRAGIGRLDRLRGLLATLRPQRLVPAASPDAPAVILFTSGSEGSPKGVALSHHNLLSNCAQTLARIDVTRQDKVFNILPVFHSFGLTGGLLMPLLQGVPVFLYPSPLHYRIVPEAVYGCNATILFGTDTFLTGYARKAHPYDFRSLRYIFAGAEKVKEETRRVWMDRFGQRILEGYGLTETSPVLSINTAMHNKSGTVGRLLPLIEHRLDPVPGIASGGRLAVKGPNVMLGYMTVEQPGVLQRLEGAWLDTGDIVDIDEAGFVRIRGRAKRFAKIAGEMVSLAAVEVMLDEIWPEASHAVVALPDPRKGERLVALTTCETADRGTVQAQARATGRTELMVPATILHLHAIPLLGTGKTDLTACRHLAEQPDTIEAQLEADPSRAPAGAPG